MLNEVPVDVSQKRGQICNANGTQPTALTIYSVTLFKARRSGILGLKFLSNEVIKMTKTTRSDDATRQQQFIFMRQKPVATNESDVIATDWTIQSICDTIRRPRVSIERRQTRCTAAILPVRQMSYAAGKMISASFLLNGRSTRRTVESSIMSQTSYSKETINNLDSNSCH